MLLLKERKKIIIPIVGKYKTITFCGRTKYKELYLDILKHLAMGVISYRYSKIIFVDNKSLHIAS